MIVGTAGHIDHGKTTLVRALTGVNTDRLPEEQRRGISIELGYAFLDVPGGDAERIGFIDVPGHERLVHTMLAGATGIHYGLLLVAADDGVMPQTREHLAVLSLLGLREGAVVVTKCDRVDAARVRTVCDEAAALLERSSLAGAPVLPVAATTGQGLTELRALLFEAARRGVGPRPDFRAFRLAVDRGFTLPGVGTVVTGTVHAGEVALGEELCLVPGTLRARVRSLHAQNQPASRALAGQRCAIALAGVDKAQVHRGQWLVAPGVALSTDRFDARLSLWHDESKPLRSGMGVRVHLGAAEVLATVAVLDEVSLAPGDSALVQLVLRQPVGAWQGDRVVLRDESGSRTLAGGQVLDPFAPVRYRRTAQRLSELAALALRSMPERLDALLAVAPQGVDIHRFAAAQGDLNAAGPVTAICHADGHGQWALGERQAREVRDRALEALAQFHATFPQELGPDTARLRRLSAPRLVEPLWQALLEGLKADGQILSKGAFVHLPAHGVQLSAAETRVAQKVAPMLAQAGFEGVWVRDLARDAAEPEPQIRVVLARLAQRGELHQVVRDLYYHPSTIAELTRLVRQVARQNEGEVVAARFRDATQLGRKRAIQILEYFDRIGLLRRLGDVHKLRTDSGLFLESVP